MTLELEDRPQTQWCHSNPSISPLAENETCAKQNAYQKQIDDAIDVSCLMLTTMSAELKKQHEHVDAYDMIEHLQRLFEGSTRQKGFDNNKALQICLTRRMRFGWTTCLKIIGIMCTLTFWVSRLV